MYADIGGMDIQKQEVREAVELPLTHFELYKQVRRRRRPGKSGLWACGWWWDPVAHPFPVSFRLASILPAASSCMALQAAERRC